MSARVILLISLLVTLVSGCTAPGTYQVGDVVSYTDASSQFATVILAERDGEFMTATIRSDNLDRWRVVDTGTKRWGTKSDAYKSYPYRIGHVEIDDLWGI